MNGADKPMLMLAGKPLVQHVIGRIAPQVEELLINATGDTSRFAGFGCKVVADRADGQPGPLAGILGGVEWTRRYRPDTEWIISVPCDCPFLPPDLVNRLVTAAEAQNAPVAVAASASRHHPVIAAWRAGLPLDSGDVLVKRGLRKVDDLIDSFPNVRVEFGVDRTDPFFNINSPEDLAQAESLIAGGVCAIA